jgi:hypothetical protein
MLRKSPWSAADQRAAKAARKMHPRALHVGSCRAPHRQRLIVIAKLNADLLQDEIGVGFDEGESLLVEHLIIGELAADEGELVDLAGLAQRSPRFRSAAAPATATPPLARFVGVFRIHNRHHASSAGKRIPSALADPRRARPRAARRKAATIGARWTRACPLVADRGRSVVLRQVLRALTGL